MKSSRETPSPNELDLSIGELAARFGLETQVLRHWETVGLLAPTHRVSGRRRYGREAVATVGVILRGKETGFSLAEIRELLAANNHADRHALLRRQRAQLEARIREAEAQIALVDHALKCRAPTITSCGAFQRLVEELEGPKAPCEPGRKTGNASRRDAVQRPIPGGRGIGAPGAPGGATIPGSGVGVGRRVEGQGVGRAPP